MTTERTVKQSENQVVEPYVHLSGEQQNLPLSCQVARYFIGTTYGIKPDSPSQFLKQILTVNEGYDHSNGYREDHTENFLPLLTKKGELIIGLNTNPNFLYGTDFFCNLPPITPQQAQAYHHHRNFYLPTISQIEQTPNRQINLEREQANFAKHARDILVESNLLLANKYAPHFLGRGLSFEDLVQCGRLGLIRAAEKFDVHRGYKFSTYATPWVLKVIRQEIINTASDVRLPNNIHRDLSRILSCQEQHFQESAAEPTYLQIAQETGIDPEIVKNILLTHLPTSLDTPFQGEETLSRYHFLTNLDPQAQPASVAEAQEQKNHIHHLLSPLSEQHRQVIELRFGLDDDHDRTLTEVGAVLGFTRQRAGQLEAQALEKLREKQKTPKQ